MRILCLNANTTPFVTRTVADEMRATLGDSADVTEATPAFGPAIIRSRADNAVAAHGMIDAARASAPGHDAVLLAVSFDTALAALRETLDMPVVGMTEASVAMARMTGGPVGYVSLGPGLVPLYREALAHCDLGRDMAGWRAFEAPSAYREGDKAALDALLAGAVRDLADDGAGVVVLLGAVLAGAARRIGGDAPVGVVDGGTAGALMAQAMVRLRRV